MTIQYQQPAYHESNSRNDMPQRMSFARAVYLEEPRFDQNEGLSDDDKMLADSFPASDTPALP